MGRTMRLLMNSELRVEMNLLAERHSAPPMLLIFGQFRVGKLSANL
jgi:hypothetical protein